MPTLIDVINSTLRGVQDPWGLLPPTPAQPTMQQQLAGSYLGDVPQVQPPAALQFPSGGGGGSTSSRNLANFNFGNVKNIRGGWEQYASREDGLMGVGERVLRYNNAPERGWHAQTLRQMVDIYAPANDGNNPAEYAAFLGRRLGVNPNAPVNFRDPRILAGLIQAMPIMEHGANRVAISDAEALSAANKLLQGVKPQRMSPSSIAENIVQNNWRWR